MPGRELAARAIDAGLDPTDWLERQLRRPGAVLLLIVLLWALAVFPNLAVRSFIWEEGTNAEIARDVLAHGRFLEPVIYGIRWYEKPSLLPWLIAGVAAVTGEVNEWSARLPAMVAALLTALLVHTATRRCASATASLFAALSFLFSPMLLQRLAIAEPDTIVTLLSFAAFLVWWNGMAAGRVTILRWIGCGSLLAALALAKGPQPTGYFALGVLAYVLLEHRWRDLAGLAVCMTLPVAVTVAWAAAVYRPGDETAWLAYARLGPRPALIDWIGHNARSLAILAVELVPAIVVLPFVARPWWRDRIATDYPAIVAPLTLYAGVCTAAVIVWPGFNGRYAMPIAPALAVLAGIAWDQLGQSKYSLARLSAATLLCLLVVYQLSLVAIVVPLYADRFGASRIAGVAIGQAIRAAPAPTFCSGLHTNQLFYMREPVACRDEHGFASATAPAWLIIPGDMLPAFARLRPDLDVRPVVATTSGPGLVAARLDKR